MVSINGKYAPNTASDNLRKEYTNDDYLPWLYS